MTGVRLTQRMTGITGGAMLLAACGSGLDLTDPVSGGPARAALGGQVSEPHGAPAVAVFVKVLSYVQGDPTNACAAIPGAPAYEPLQLAQTLTDPDGRFLTRLEFRTERPYCVRLVAEASGGEVSGGAAPVRRAEQFVVVQARRNIGVGSARDTVLVNVTLQ